MGGLQTTALIRGQREAAGEARRRGPQSRPRVIRRDQHRRGSGPACRSHEDLERVTQLQVRGATPPQVSLRGSAQ